MSNPYLERSAKAGKQAHGKKSEKRVAKSVGARLTPSSGALESAKGDFTLPEFLGEAKSTIHATLPIEYDWLLKITHEAKYKGKTPLVTLSFVTGDGSVKREGDWVLLPLAFFQTLNGT